MFRLVICTRNRISGPGFKIHYRFQILFFGTDETGIGLSLNEQIVPTIGYDRYSLGGPTIFVDVRIQF